MSMTLKTMKSMCCGLSVVFKITTRRSTIDVRKKSDLSRKNRTPGSPAHVRKIWDWPEPVYIGLHIVIHVIRTIRSRYWYYLIPIQGIEMIHSKCYSKSLPTSGTWEKKLYSGVLVTKVIGLVAPVPMMCRIARAGLWFTIIGDRFTTFQAITWANVDPLPLHSESQIFPRYSY